MRIHDHDAELRAHNERLRAAVDVSAGDRVLDIGCGAGQSTREAARRAAPASVLGIDVSAPMLERARELTAAEGSTT
jgi:cyclopropane fatty-acyl-phospholipid synthase-like methyltransferase